MAKTDARIAEKATSPSDSRNIAYDGGPHSTNDRNAMRTVTNLTEEAFTHTFDGREYRIKAGETQPFPEFVALNLSRQLAKKILYQGLEDDVTGDGARSPNAVTMKEVVEKQGELLDVDQRETSEKKTSESDETEKEEKKTEAEKIVEESFVCEECGFVAKSKAGLKAHMRKHDKK